MKKKKKYYIALGLLPYKLKFDIRVPYRVYAWAKNIDWLDAAYTVYPNFIDIDTEAYKKKIAEEYDAMNTRYILGERVNPFTTAYEAPGEGTITMDDLKEMMDLVIESEHDRTKRFFEEQFKIDFDTHCIVLPLSWAHKAGLNPDNFIRSNDIAFSQFFEGNQMYLIKKDNLFRPIVYPGEGGFTWIDETTPFDEKDWSKLLKYGRKGNQDAN